MRDCSIQVEHRNKKRCIEKVGKTISRHLHHLSPKPGQPGIERNTFLQGKASEMSTDIFGDPPPGLQPQQADSSSPGAPSPLVPGWHSWSQEASMAQVSVRPCEPKIPAQHSTKAVPQTQAPGRFLWKPNSWFPHPTSLVSSQISFSMSLASKSDSMYPNLQMINRYMKRCSSSQKCESKSQ